MHVQKICRVENIPSFCGYKYCWKHLNIYSKENRPTYYIMHYRLVALYSKINKQTKIRSTIKVDRLFFLTTRSVSGLKIDAWKHAGAAMLSWGGTVFYTINARPCYCFTSVARKKTYSIKRQCYKENSFLFKINNTSLFSERESNQSTYTTFTRSDSLQNEVIEAAVQQLSCYALVSLSSLFNMHATTHGAPNQTNTKAICYPERRIAITISATSHWFTHLFFCRGTDRETV